MQLVKDIALLHERFVNDLRTYKLFAKQGSQGPHIQGPVFCVTTVNSPFTEEERGSSELLDTWWASPLHIQNHFNLAKRKPSYNYVILILKYSREKKKERNYVSNDISQIDITSENLNFQIRQAISFISIFARAS